MAALEVRRNDLLPDVISSNSVISACGKGGRWQRAPGFIAGKRPKDLLPSVISCSSVISACEKGGQWQHSECDAMICWPM